MVKQEVITAITPQVRAQVAHLLEQAERVVIGAGWGLSLAAGLSGADTALGAEFAPLLAAGLRTYGEAESFLTAEDARFWGYWFRRIKELRFGLKQSAVHEALLSLVKVKEYAVLATTVDGLFYKSAEEARVYPLEGDLSRVQCAENCRGETYAVLGYLRRALGAIDPETLALPADKLPRCPHCGALLVPNIASQVNFCAAPFKEAARLANAYLKEAGPLVLLEVGVGYGAPNLIRFPFEYLTESRSDVTLIRINDRYPLCAEENRDKAVCIGMDAAAALPALAAK